MDAFIAALETKDTTKMPLASATQYVENTKSTTLGQGIWQTALTVAFRRSLLDVEQCESFTEVIITEGDHPYVLGVRVKVADGRISEIEALATDQDDWLFDATKYLSYSKGEDWGAIAADKQNTREELVAAAAAYFDYFADKSVVVPWGSPCSRLEGGSAYTGQSCNVGVPDGVQFGARHFLVDVEIGAAVGMVRMGGDMGLPDSHLFRVNSGKIRYIHTLTVCTVANCGM